MNTTFTHGTVTLHNSTVYLLIYIVVHFLLYFIRFISRGRFLLNFLFKFRKKITVDKSNPKPEDKKDIDKQIETEKKRIHMYTQIIEDNREQNKHLGEYDLFILNGKYKRQLLKHQNILNGLLEKQKGLENEAYSQKNGFIRNWDRIIILFYSKNKIITYIRKQLGIIFIYLILKYIPLTSTKLTCLNLYSTVEFTKISGLAIKEICRNNLIRFLINYNITSVFVYSLKNYLKDLFGLFSLTFCFKSKLKKS